MADNQKFVFASKNLTINSVFDAESIFNNTTLTTASIYRQLLFRRAIIKIVQLIKETESRLSFCATYLPKFLAEAKAKSWMRLKKDACKYVDTQKDDISREFENNLSHLYNLLKTGAVRMTDEETYLIAEKLLHDQIAIPLSMPTDKICCHCFKRNSSSLLPCKGNCARSYHKKCTNVVESRRKTSSHHDCCKNCGHPAPNKKPKCSTCKIQFEAKDIVTTCIDCSESFHLRASCVPAGASKLSETQIICRNHKLNEELIKVCSICYKKGGNAHRLYDCKKCANRFHKDCNSNQLECSQCQTARKVESVILTAGDVWPAIIIPKDQVPTDYLKRQLYGPGSLIVFLIGKNVYEEIYSKNVLSLRIDDELLAKICRKDDANRRNAIDIARKLFQSKE